MKFRELSLSGAWEINIERREDARGFFARSYCDREFSDHGLNTTWVQMNVSFSLIKGTLRGLHFQRDTAAEVKLVRCSRGRVFDVIVDLRSGSPTFGQHCSVVLDSELRNSIYIPVGFAHGFQTLSDGCELQYSHSSAYQIGHEGGVNALDPTLDIAWPLPPTVMSDRDRDLVPLTECKPL